MKHRIIITVLFLVTSTVSFSQKHQIGASIGGGMQTLFYKPTIADHKQGFGGTMSVDYQYFLQKQWSIGSGICISSYAAKSYIDTSIGETQHDDTHNEDFEYRTTYNEWTEKQNFLQLEIPIAVYYHYEINKAWNLQCGFGSKVAFPLFNNYKVKGENYETSGYYESTGVEYKDMPQHGFYTQEANLKGKADVHIADVQLFTDLGIAYVINSSMDIYVGLYCSYGLTSQVNDSNTNLLSAGDYTGMLSSSEVNSLHNFALGAKVGIQKTIGHTKRTLMNQHR